MSAHGPGTPPPQLGQARDETPAAFAWEQGLAQQRPQAPGQPAYAHHVAGVPFTHGAVPYAPHDAFVGGQHGVHPTAQQTHLMQQQQARIHQQAAQLQALQQQYQRAMLRQHPQHQEQQAYVPHRAMHVSTSTSSSPASSGWPSPPPHAPQAARSASAAGASTSMLGQGPPWQAWQMQQQQQQHAHMLPALPPSPSRAPAHAALSQSAPTPMHSPSITPPSHSSSQHPSQLPPPSSAYEGAQATAVPPASSLPTTQPSHVQPPTPPAQPMQPWPPQQPMEVAPTFPHTVPAAPVHAVAAPVHAAAAPVHATAAPVSSAAVAAASASPASLSVTPVPPAPSRVLRSPLDGDVWLLMLHQLYHTPADWARSMAHTLFQQLQQEVLSSASAGTHAGLLLTASDWTGAPRPLSLDELMARQGAASFPPDYLPQLMRELLAGKSREAAASGAADPSSSSSSQGSRFKALLPGTGHSLAPEPTSAPRSLWTSGSNALMPSLRRRLAPGARSPSGSVLHMLRQRELGGWGGRTTVSSPPTAAAASHANTLYASRMRKLKVVTGHTHPIYCVAVDRTGRRAFTGSDDNTLKVWDVHSGRLLATCRGHESEITEISVSPDNTLVASASCDSRIRLWDLNGVPVGVLTGHRADATRVQFNPDWSPTGRRLLISISLDGTARVWDCANLSGAPQVITCKPRAWSSQSDVPYVPYDLELLARQGNEQEDSLGSLAPSHANPEFLCISFHPSGSEFVCGHNDHRARVYSLPHRCLLAVLTGHKAEVDYVSYSMDGSRILSVGSDGECIVWSRVEWEEVQDAARIVGAKMPTQPPQNIWAHDAAAPLVQANFYAGLRRVAAAAAAANGASNAPAASPSPSPPPAAAAAASSGQPPLPTHRYFILARLVATPPPSSDPTSAAAAAPSATSSSSAAAASANVSGSGGSSNKSTLAVWSLHDDYVVGSTSHGVVVWKLPPVLREGEGTETRVRLERVDPHMEQHLQHVAQSKMAATRASTGATKQPERATGRSKRSSATQQAAAAGANASAAPSPLTFLSCFRRHTLHPSLRFDVHRDADVVVLHRHPVLADLFVTAGADGRVVLYDVARGKVVRVFRESQPSNGLTALAGGTASTTGSRVPVNFVDGAFTPASSTGGHMLLLSTEHGQLYFFGAGVSPRPFLAAPEQQFFVRDYLAVQRDQFDNVLDVDGQCPPHLASGATTLCDLNGFVYLQPLPPVAPMPVRPLPVALPHPPRAPVRIRLFGAGREPRFSLSTHLGWPGRGEDGLVEVDTDVWRTSAQATSAWSHVRPDVPPVQNAAAHGAQLARDIEAHEFEYQLRLAWQQQREVIRVANRAQDAEAGIALRSGRSRTNPVSVAPTWYPLLELPLPPHTPLLRAHDDDDAYADLDREEGLQETAAYRSCLFGPTGVVRRHRLPSSHTGAARPAGMSSLSMLRTPGAASLARPAARSHRAGAGAAAAAGRAPASNIHTLGTSRRRPILLEEGDDDYRDDSYDPTGCDPDDVGDGAAAAAAASSRNQRRQARAQGRALQRFEELKQDDPVSAAPLVDEDDEKLAALHAVADAPSREHSEYSDADGAAAAASGAESSASEEDESEAHLSLPSSNSDSDASYGTGRNSDPYSHLRKRKRKAPGSAARSSDSRSQRRRDRSRERPRIPHRAGAAAAYRAAAAAAAAAGGGAASAASSSARDTRRASKRARRSTDEWSDGAEFDEDEEEEEEEDDERARRSAVREARARKRHGAGGVSFSQRSASQKARSYQDTGSDEEARLFAEEQGDYAERVGGEPEDDDDNPLVGSVLAAESNWLEKPLTQMYNASYTPQLGDEVVYCRVGHEATLARQPLLPRSHLPRPSLPPFVECVVVRIEYMWSQDAFTGQPANPHSRLPLNAQGLIDTGALRKLAQPFVFARLVLVPRRDVHLIRNDALPQLAETPAASGVKQEHAHPSASSVKQEPEDVPPPSYVRAPSPPSNFDVAKYFALLPPPKRWFAVAHADESRIRLRRVPHAGDEWVPRVKEETTAAAAAAHTLISLPPKRVLRGHVAPATEAPPLPATNARTTPPSSELFRESVPARQSMRHAILQSLHDAPPASQPTPSSSSQRRAPPSDSEPPQSQVVSSASSSSGRTRIVLRRGAGGGHTAAEPAGPPLVAQADDEEASRSLALKLQSQPARTSTRQRQPKKPDPYEAQLITNAPQQLSEKRARGGAGSSRSTAQQHGVGSGDGLELPPSSFVVDLFEPTEADYIVLASRFRACPGMARWLTMQDEADGATGSARHTPSPSQSPAPYASAAAAAAAAASASAASASSAPSPPREWRCGDRFRMKFVDTTEWSTGVVLSNAMCALEELELTQAAAASASAGGRVTRNQLKGGSTATPTGPTTAVTPWGCLRVSWKSEEEIAALIAEEEAARSAALVQSQDLSHLSPDDRAALLRLQFLLRMEAEDQVSPWEIDPLDRPVGEMDDLEVWKASMDAEAHSNSAREGARSALAPSRLFQPSLVHLGTPDVVLDPSEHLAAPTVAALVSVLDSAIADPRFEAFVSPVPRRDFPQYVHVVPYSMSLQIMRSRLDLRYYRSVAALARDVRALFEAARLFNDPRSDIVRMAAELEREIVRDLFRAAPRDLAPFVQPANPVEWALGEGEEEGQEEAEAEVEAEGAPATTKVEAGGEVSDERKDPSVRGAVGAAAAADEVAPMELDTDEVAGVNGTADAPEQDSTMMDAAVPDPTSAPGQDRPADADAPALVPAPAPERVAAATHPPAAAAALSPLDASLSSSPAVLPFTVRLVPLPDKAEAGPESRMLDAPEHKGP